MDPMRSVDHQDEEARVTDLHQSGEPVPGFDVAVTDSRRAMAYLIAPYADEYVSIMAVLESSITDLTPAEVAAALQAGGVPLDARTVEVRLDRLRDWTAASARTDSSRILRYADLMARNWRWTATPAGRQVQRFYSTVLAGTPAMREIPLSSLNRVVVALTGIVDLVGSGRLQSGIAEDIGRLFTSHDDLDAALVGAEDTLATLADRFDLDHVSTAELKQLLVEYATRVAAELESGAARAHGMLLALQPSFGQLADVAVEASDARALIERGALTASRGGRRADWDQLLLWCDPVHGRAARFAMRLVRALPGMHANLRRLHASSSAATGRSRALQLARACSDIRWAQPVFLAAVGDHPWRKLHEAADDDELGRVPSWWGGPTVEVPEMLRKVGRSGARGRAAAARDDSEARVEVAARRRRRQVEHAAALDEVLRGNGAAEWTDAAARVALVALQAAARARPAGSRRDRRTGHRDGLGCTIFRVPGRHGVLRAPTWRVLLPGRVAVFHPVGARVAAPDRTAPDDAVRVGLRLVGRESA